MSVGELTISLLRLMVFLFSVLLRLVRVYGGNFPRVCKWAKVLERTLLDPKQRALAHLLAQVHELKGKRRSLICKTIAPLPVLSVLAVDEVVTPRIRPYLALMVLLQARWE